MNFLEVKNISKQQQGIITVNNVSFVLPQLRKLAIAGETGSGKSTLMKIIAGLVQPDEGEIVMNGKKVKGPMEKLLAGHSEIAYLSQYFELRNNYRVEEELDYLNQLSKDQASQLFAVCRIQHLLKRKTTEVSGGEKQRISLARLLLSRPQLLLLDEPYSNLDIIHKSILKKVVNNVAEQLNITCILVSHDPNDLLSWADEILIMKDGKAVQQGTPQHIYHQPVNEYVAALLGSYNVLRASMFNAFVYTTVEEGDYKILVRPEQFIINSLQSKFIKGKVKDVRFLGSAYEVDVVLDNNEEITAKTNLMNVNKDDVIRVSLLPNNIHLMD